MKNIIPILLFLSFHLPNSAYSCLCEKSYDTVNIDVYLNLYQAIFIGELVSVFNVKKDGEWVYDAELKIEKSFKGTKGKTIILHQLRTGGGMSCDLVLDIGRKYLIYAFEDYKGRLTTDYCSRTKPYYDKKAKRNIEKQLKNFEKGIKPDLFTPDAEWAKAELQAFYGGKNPPNSEELINEIAILESFKTIKSQYYLNGYLLAEGEVKNGKPDGKWIFYDEEGKILSEGYFVKGKKVGIWSENHYGRNYQFLYTKDRRLELFDD